MDGFCSPWLEVDDGEVDSLADAKLNLGASDGFVVLCWPKALKPPLDFELEEAKLNGPGAC